MRTLNIAGLVGSFWLEVRLVGKNVLVNDKAQDNVVRARSDCW